jgi:transposase
VLNAVRNRLKDTGKIPKVVIVAVMRKMITMLNARVRDDVVWATTFTVGTSCRP